VTWKDKEGGMLEGQEARWEEEETAREEEEVRKGPRP
jgi:hypothetical protein